MTLAEKTSTAITVFIIDMSSDTRDIISKTLNLNSDIEVLGTAPNGHIGLLKVLDIKPDVVILNASIKNLTPVNFTKTVLEKLGKCGIILTINKGISSGILDSTIQSLESGAFDIIEKPDKVLSEQKKVEYYNRKLLVKIRGYSIKRYSQIAREASRKKDKKVDTDITENILSKIKIKNDSTYKALLIGVSTGGPRALSAIIPELPVLFPLPTIIVLHLPEYFTAGMAHELDRKSGLKVIEAKEGDSIKQGFVYLAKGGRHLTIEKGINQNCMFKYMDSPPVNNCKPSVDVLFESASGIFKEKTIGVILTGMGVDGAKGIIALKNNGARTFVQDRETSVVWGMPGAAVNTGCVDEILPLNRIFERILEII